MIQGQGKRSECPKCGVLEGRYHDFGCGMERCPFCGFQLIGCDYAYEMLNLFNRRAYPETSGLPPEIYENGLPDHLWERWELMCKAKGRHRFIGNPQRCDRCGVLWPEFFVVRDHIWRKCARSHQVCGKQS